MTSRLAMDVDENEEAELRRLEHLLSNDTTEMGACEAEVLPTTVSEYNKVNEKRAALANVQLSMAAAWRRSHRRRPRADLACSL